MKTHTYMQSYKLRKTSETVLFPIEHELRLLRQDNTRSWNTLMLKILSVVFSGIGTTILSQEDYIPALIKYVIYYKFKICMPKGWMVFLEILSAVALFIILSLIIITIVNLYYNSKDNKKDDIERENLAETFHKIILNNIITGKSFTKKAKVKFNEMQDCIDKAYNANNQEIKDSEEQIREIKREFCLYWSEAFYYFVIAEKQIKKEKIIEIGERKEYKEYLKEVGALTLLESLLMFEKSVDELKNLSKELQDISTSIWSENEYEAFSMLDNISIIDEIKESILNWKTDLSNTIKKMKK